MRKLATLAFALAATVATTTVQAKTFWSDYSVTYLNGSNYELGDKDREVLTFEHVAGTSWGDSFMFVDRLMSKNGDLETYMEWSPRIKITDFEKDSFIKNVFVASTIEMGTSFSKENYGGYGFNNYLLGVGTDLNIPGFNFFQVNVYGRSNENADSNAQVTLAWAVPLGPVILDGFLDYATSTANSFGDIEDTIITQIQLKYDIAPHIGLDSKLYVGVEYAYWMNKFGVDGVDESNLNFLVKFHY